MSIFINRRASRLVVGPGVLRTKIEKVLATTMPYSNIILMMSLDEVKQFVELSKNSVSKDTPQIPLNNISHRAAVDWLIARLDSGVTGSLYVLLNRSRVIEWSYWRLAAIPKIEQIAPKLKVYLL